MNRTFMVMAMAMGLDAAILDVCDEECGTLWPRRNSCSAMEIYSDAYLKAYRQRGAASSAAQQKLQERTKVDCSRQVGVDSGR